MRSAVCLALLATGCSSLLGIQDPSAGTVDAAIDAPVDDGGGGGSDTLILSLTTVKLAQQQVVPLRVQRMPASGAAVDVTNEATLTPDKTNIVDLRTKGRILGAAAGTVTITVNAPGGKPTTLVATVSAFTCHPVINEFTTGTAANGADDEFIEVFNPCAATMTVTNWTLNYRGANGSTGPDAHGIATLAGQMAPGELRVYAGQTYPGTAISRWPTSFGMGQQAGAIALRNGPTDSGAGDEGDIIDSVAYGASVVAAHPFIETKALGDMANNMSASRGPYDGRDDAATGSDDGDNSVDFKIITTPTPGAANK